MKTFLCTFLTTAALLTAWTSATAQGTAFTYQGQLSVSGSPANGSYDLTFTLYDTNVPPGNVVAGPLTNSATSVTNGLFTVTLDFGAGVFNGSNYWLEIAAATNGGASTTLSPRQPVTPAPYAIYAPNAGTSANVTGAIGLAQLPGVVVTNGASGVNISGSFSGNGAGVTNLQLSSLGPPGTLGQITVPVYFNLTPYATGHYLYYVAVADINCDGKPDLITADVGVNLLTVLTNNGSGVFGSNATLTVGNGPASIAVADVNGDGKPDLISANVYDNTLSVLTNNGSGVFFSNATLNVGQYPLSVTAADINGDGKPDLICANTLDDTLTVLTNNGSGVFFSNATLNVGPYPYFVVAADINGDGKPDLICADTGANTLTVLTNNGSGVFGFNASPIVGNRPISVAVADINGDGKPDLICANENDGTVTVLTNNGSGVFGSNATLSVGNGPYSVVVADVNDDGKPDIITANAGDNTLTVLTNNGSGVFGFYATLNVGNFPVSLAAKDLTGNGLTDLICANEDDGTVSVLLASSQALSAPEAVSFTNPANNFAGSFTGSITGSGSFTVLTGDSLRLSDEPLYLRAGSDENHGLAYAGNGIFNFGSAQPDGPALWGYGGGVLGTMNQGPSTILSWNSSGVNVNGTLTATTLSGNGSGLSNLQVSQLTGTLSLAQLPAGILTNNDTNVNLSGTFDGNGGGLTNLNASELTGMLADSQLPTNVVTFSSSQPVQTNVYSTAGTNTFTIPTGVGQITVKLWGAGGGGGDQDGYLAYGGGGAFVQKTLSVFPGQTFTVVVGQHGDQGNDNGGSSGSGDAAGGNYGFPSGGQGGQASSLFLYSGGLYLAEAVAGGGGGGGYADNGGAGGNPGQNGGAPGGGTGGSNGTGGAGGSYGPSDENGSPGQNYSSAATNSGIASLSQAGGDGGNGFSVSGGGGGGFGGGGGGGGEETLAGAGGGSLGDTFIGGNGSVPGNTNDPNYNPANANGGASVAGQDGLMVVIFSEAAIANISGALEATQFIGNGASVTNLNAANLTGTISGAQMPATNLTGTISAAQLPANLVPLTTNNGGALTNLNASQLTNGTVPLSALPANLVPLTTNNGGALTNLNASQLTNGTVPLSALPANLVPLTTNNGSALTSLQAANLSGTIQQTNLGATNSFSPTIGNGTANFTTTTNVGYYAKSGNLVYFEAFIEWSSLNGINTGSANISLPFTVQSQRAVFNIGYVDGVNQSGQLVAIASAGATAISLWSNPNNGGNPITVAVSACSATGQIQISGTYRWQ